MTPAAAQPSDSTDIETEAASEYRIAGLLIVSLFPALFWTTVLAVGGYAIGTPLSPLALATFGAAIAALLAAVFNTLFSRI